MPKLSTEVEKISNHFNFPLETTREKISEAVKSSKGGDSDWNAEIHNPDLVILRRIMPSGLRTAFRIFRSKISELDLDKAKSDGVSLESMDNLSDYMREKNELIIEPLGNIEKRQAEESFMASNKKNAEFKRRRSAQERDEETGKAFRHDKKVL